jgi:hypothetical protein
VPDKPEEHGIIGPVAFTSVAVVPIVRSIPASIQFWADADTLASGDCTRLRWQVDDVREVYLDGEGVAGHDQRQVCPTETTRYELKVVRLDTTETVQTVEIHVTAP